MVRLFFIVGLLAIFLFAAQGVPGVEAQGPIVKNGTFEGGGAVIPNPDPLDGWPNDTIANSWSRRETFSSGGVETSTLWLMADNGPSLPGSTALSHTRLGGGLSGDWTALTQAIDLKANLCTSLALGIDTKVHLHDLEAGGFVSPAFEWPVVLQVVYLTTGGGSQVWRYGWFLDPPGDSVSGPINDPGMGLIPIFKDKLVPPDVWVANTFDLKAELPQLDTLTSILVGGSGWNYEGRVDNVVIACGVVQAPALSPWGSAALAGLLALFVVSLTARRRLARSPKDNA